MSVDLLTPVAGGEVIDLGNRVYRKQVLPRSSIHYRGRQLEFTDDYLNNVAQSFRDRAFDTVPFMLADHDNRHTMDPRNAAGEVLALDAEDDGLYATVRLSEDAERIVADNPAFGVSVRIKESYDRSDGRHYPAACQHVLGTFDGVVAGMKPWEAVELSQDRAESTVIDLSGMTYAEEAPMTAPAVSNEQLLDALRGLIGPALHEQHAPAQPDPDDDDYDDDQDQDRDPDGDDRDGGGDGGDPIDGWTDEQFAAWADEVLAEVSETEAAGQHGTWDHTDGGPNGEYVDVDDPDDYGHVPAGVATSQRADHGDDVLLAEQAYQSDRMDSLELSNRELRRELDGKRYETEREQLVRDHGIPPHVVDLARPLLEGSDRTISLSNGSGDVDAGEVIRSVLAEFGKVTKLLDLSDPVAAGRIAVDDNAAEHAESIRTRAQQVVSHFGLTTG